MGHEGDAGYVGHVGHMGDAYYVDHVGHMGDVSYVVHVGHVGDVGCLSSYLNGSVCFSQKPRRGCRERAVSMRMWSRGRAGAGPHGLSAPGGAAAAVAATAAAVAPRDGARAPMAAHRRRRDLAEAPADDRKRRP